MHTCQCRGFSSSSPSVLCHPSRYLGTCRPGTEHHHHPLSTPLPSRSLSASPRHPIQSSHWMDGHRQARSLPNARPEWPPIPSSTHLHLCGDPPRTKACRRNTPSPPPSSFHNRHPDRCVHNTEERVPGLPLREHCGPHGSTSGVWTNFTTISFGLLPLVVARKETHVGSSGWRGQRYSNSTAVLKSSSTNG